jgi:Cu/Ag efflux pump CusA
MRWIVSSSVRLRHLVVVMAVVVIAVGITQVRRMPVDVLPDFTPPYVEVQTEALGLSAPEVEQLITVPLEADLLNGVGGVEVIRSKSVPGMSSIVLVFEPGTDLLEARQLVQERLTQAHALPNVSKPPEMIQPLSSTSRIAMISLSSEQLSLIEQSVLARWVIRPRLMGVPGVANVAMWGLRERQLQVQVDPARLKTNGVSLSQVVKTTGNAQLVSPLSFLEASTPGSGGFIDTPNQRLGIRHVLPLGTPQELGKVPIENAGTGLRLSDVATVVEDHQPLIGDAVVNGRPGLLLVVEKFPGANIDAVTQGLETALDSMRPGLSGLELDSTVFRPASYIQSAIDNLSLSLLIAVLLIALALVLLFFDWRAVVISAVSIPIALGAAGLVLVLLGKTFNMMVAAGFLLAIGAVLADAIADVDGITRRLRERRPDQTMSQAEIEAAIVDASMQVRRPLVYATVIGVLAVVPVFFLDGLQVVFLQELLLAYALAVVAAMVVALTVTPALSALLLSRVNAGRREPPLGRRLAHGVGMLLTRIIRHPRPAYVAAALTAVAGLAVLPLLLGPSLVPNLQERNLVISWDSSPGTSHPEMSRITVQATRELRAIPGVTNVTAHLGRAITADQVVGMNSGELWLTIDPDADYDATKAAVQEVVAAYPGLSGAMGSYHRARVSDARAFEHTRLSGDDGSGGVLAREDSTKMAGADDVVVRVFGQELPQLREQAEKVRQILSDIDGVVDSRVELQTEEPNVEVKVDIAAARAHQIKPGDVRRAAAVLLQGIQVGSLFEQQKVFEVVVLGTPQTRHSLTSIRGLLIDKPDGNQVRLGDVADVRIVPTPTVINREAVSRRMDVGAVVSGRDVDSVIADVQDRLAEVQFPLEYHAATLAPRDDFVGGLSLRETAYLVAAAIGIFLILQAAFGSWRLSAVLFLTLPLALVGGLLVAVGLDRELSLGALAGLFAVLGLAVRNSVLLVGRYQELSQSAGSRFGPELALRGVSDRLAPILVGAAATALALAPLALAGQIAGHEIARPMALVVLGGLVTSTAFSLILVPLLCLRFWPAPSLSGDAPPERG